jgi:hypothetical protein
VRVAYRLIGSLAIEVDARFHCVDARTIVMTIVRSEGEGSVVETPRRPAGRAARPSSKRRSRPRITPPSPPRVAARRCSGRSCASPREGSGPRTRRTPSGSTRYASGRPAQQKHSIILQDAGSLHRLGRMADEPHVRRRPKRWLASIPVPSSAPQGRTPSPRVPGRSTRRQSAIG